jgi:hypothetical protein
MRIRSALVLMVVSCGGHDNGATPDACTDADGDGVTDCAGDCDDNDPNTYPGAPEICGDAKDNTCDGNVDEGCNGLGTFVSAAVGNDTNPGTQAAPVATIGQGMANAAAIGGGQDVYVAGGHYTEKITMVEQRDLYGGYDCSAASCTWTRDPATYDTAILDTDFEGVLVVDSITRATKLDGFRIVGMSGAPSAAPGGAAISVYGAATITNNKIVGGDISQAAGTASIGVAVYAPSGNPLIATNDIALGTSPQFAAGVDFLRGLAVATGTANGEVRANVIHGGTARTTAGVYGGQSGTGTIIATNTITSGSSNVAGGGAWGIQGFGTMLIDSNKINVPPAVPGACGPADFCGGIESQSSTSTITNNVIYGAPAAHSAAVRLREVEIAAGTVVLNSNYLDGGGSSSPGGSNQTVSAAVALEYTGCGQCGVNAVMGRIRDNTLLGGAGANRYGIYEVNSPQRTNRPEALDNNVFWFAPASGVSNDVLWHQWNGTLGTDLLTIAQVNLATMPPATANQNADPKVDATWHLTAGSPCIDMGTATESPTTDMDGNARPNGAPDIGPDEM